MKKLLKIILPPLAAFGFFFIVITIDSIYHQMRFEHISEGTLHSLMAYFYFFAPLLFIVALLTQLLITVPVWRYIRNNKQALWIAAIILILICLTFAIGVSFLMWGSISYLTNWINSCLVMIVVQLVYWAINIFILYLLDKKTEYLPPGVNI